ncbi:MAG: hypothetical protein GXP01_05330 [Alphaproteobacteria bacterium]|nr:hypothetical protein [Alphaproteobacteria bacterium]
MQISRRKLRALGDLGLLAAVAVGVSVLFIGAADLPAPRFEPLGSAAMPKILGVLLILLSLPIAFRAIRNLLRRDPADAKQEPPIQLPHRGVLVFGALLAYAAALDFGRVPFVLATTVFVALSGMAISGISVRSVLIYIFLGLGLSLALSYIFTNFLYVRFA